LRFSLVTKLKPELKMLCSKLRRRRANRAVQLCCSKRRCSRCSWPNALTTRRHDRTSWMMVSAPLSRFLTCLDLSLKYFPYTQTATYRSGEEARANRARVQSTRNRIHAVTTSVNPDCSRCRKLPHSRVLMNPVSFWSRYIESPTEFRSWYENDSRCRWLNMSAWKSSVTLELTRFFQYSPTTSRALLSRRTTRPNRIATTTMA